MTDDVMVNKHEHWAEHPDHALPEGLLEIAEGDDISPELTGLKVTLSARTYPNGPENHFHAHLGDTLGQVFEKAAHALHTPLLPPLPIPPLDLLFVRCHDGLWGEPKTDLGIPLWVALAEGLSRHVAIDYRLVVRINTKWGVASARQMTPRALLTEFGFNPDDFSLYKADGTQPLPPDTPIDIERGAHLEAQKDGRYGGALSPSFPIRGLQTIEDDVECLKGQGLDIHLHNINAQKYVEVLDLRIPSAPWSHTSATILIAVPGTYPAGGLDALYLLSGVTQQGGVPRQQATAQLLNRTWGLISWHYTAGRPWNPQRDDLGTHIEHCRGYFLARGVKQ